MAGGCTANENETENEKYVLHEWLLAGWGMPIGEMFDLERLAETCHRLSRWEFFLVSVPLKVSLQRYLCLSHRDNELRGLDRLM